MRNLLATLMFAALLFGVQPAARAQDTVIPAGTLIRCTMDEPNFSTATASVGDPVVCHLSSLQLYGRNVFPRGSYLGGHLEAAKEPGHFVGKGYLQIQFDRIGFPTSDIPVPSKVIAAKGYKVDKQGDIVGHGHAKRDVVEWMIPPLWPWKLIMLPARGPRPTLKGEEQITLRLMDDIVMPRTTVTATSYDRPVARFRPQPSYDRPPYAYRTQSDNRAASVPRGVETTSETTLVTPAESKPVPAMVRASVTTTESAAPAPEPEAVDTGVAIGSEMGQHLTVVVLKTGEMFAVTSYRVDDGNLNYVLTNGAQSGVSTQDVDWRRTSQLNARRTPVAEASPTRGTY
jgi:hypothetical protein